MGDKTGRILGGGEYRKGEGGGRFGRVGIRWYGVGLGEGKGKERVYVR